MNQVRLTHISVYRTYTVPSFHNTTPPRSHCEDRPSMAGAQRLICDCRWNYVPPQPFTNDGTQPGMDDAMVLEVLAILVFAFVFVFAFRRHVKSSSSSRQQVRSALQRAGQVRNLCIHSIARAVEQQFRSALRRAVHVWASGCCSIMVVVQRARRMFESACRITTKIVRFAPSRSRRYFLNVLERKPYVSHTTFLPSCCMLIILAESHPQRNNSYQSQG